MEQDDNDDESLLSRFEKQRSLLREPEGQVAQLNVEEEELLKKSDDVD